MTTLANVRRYGNSFGKSERQRAAWTKGLGIPVKDVRKEPAHTLWYSGDYAAYDPALAEDTRTTARVFQRAGLDFGLLYEAERNAGNDVRRIGEEGLFELLKTKNGAAFDKGHFEEIVTTDPHTYNTLKNEYDLDRPVYHYSEVLDRAIASGRLPVRRPLNYAVTYHDPCYLARYNGVYEAPRRVLEAIGCRVVEMPRNRERSVCCGAGGGRIWMQEAPSVKERPAENRVREAAALPGLSALVVACPKDCVMFRDALKTTGLETQMKVVDLIALVDEATRDEKGALP
jgi:Fe-S oxidoreductase